MRIGGPLKNPSPTGGCRKSQNVGWADDRKPNKIKIIDFYYLSKPAFYDNLHREMVRVNAAKLRNAGSPLLMEWVGVE